MMVELGPKVEMEDSDFEDEGPTNPSSILKQAPQEQYVENNKITLDDIQFSQW